MQLFLKLYVNTLMTETEEEAVATFMLKDVEAEIKERKQKIMRAGRGTLNLLRKKERVKKQLWEGGVEAQSMLSKGARAAQNLPTWPFGR